MVSETKALLHTKRTAVLGRMLERNEEITARAVTRLHSVIKNASDITRHERHRAILEKYQQKQAELRKFTGKVRNAGTTIATKNLQAFNERVRELEANPNCESPSNDYGDGRTWWYSKVTEILRAVCTNSSATSQARSQFI